MEEALHHNREARWLAGGWWLLALFALAVSTMFAVLLVVARSPLLEQFAASTGFFREALVMHVNLAVVVWFLACAAGLWTLLADAVSCWRWLAFALAASGLLLMLAAPFVDTPVPVLANYVPVLDSPVFLSGLAAFLAGVTWCGVAAAGAVARRIKSSASHAWRYGAALSLVAAAVALGAMLASLTATGGMAASDRYETLAWGPGHVLQFVHVLLLMSAWTYLGERVFGRQIAPQRWLAGLLALAAMPVLAVPAIYAWYPVGSPQFRHAFTMLMSFGAWPAAALLAVYMLSRIAGARGSIRVGADIVPLVFSMLLFLLGCVLGAAIRSETTMVPAHYHCTVGAVTLAYMAIGYRMLPAFGLGAGKGRLFRWQPAIYGAGLLVLALALAWSGWLGVPRKTMSADLALQSPAYLTAMGLAGLGGLLAIVGAALFVFNIARAPWLKYRKTTLSASASHPRWQMSVLAVLLTVAGGLIIINFNARISVSPPAAQIQTLHARQKIAAEVAQRFQQGVVMLHAKRYEDALTAFHRVIELTPEMPEVHVNMGYALLGLQRFEAARDFFESATALKPNQVNAYYGLAEALEGLHDMPGALGAMRTYLHLAPAEDPYRRKAESAIWEWDEALKLQKQKQKETPAAEPDESAAKR